MGVLLVVALLAGAALFLHLRSRQQATAPSPLQVICRVSLSARAGLALLETDDDRLIVAWGETPPQLIARVSPDGAWEMPDLPPQKAQP